MLLFVHCQDTSVIPWHFKASESFILLILRNTLHYWQVGREKMCFIDTHLGVELRLKNDMWVPSPLQTEMRGPTSISAPLYALSNTTICHSKIEVLEHIHTAYISSPLPAHSIYPLHFASHRWHVSFHTAPYSIPFTLHLSLLPLTNKTGSALSSRNRNLS